MIARNFIWFLQISIFTSNDICESDLFFLFEAQIKQFNSQQTDENEIKSMHQVQEDNKNVIKLFIISISYVQNR